MEENVNGMAHNNQDHPLEMRAHSSQMKHKGLISMSAHDLQNAKNDQYLLNEANLHE